MRVFDGSNFKIYVYKDHPPPHCHILFTDGSEIVVDLINIEPMFGEKLTRKVKKIISENLEDLFATWERLNY